MAFQADPRLMEAKSTPMKEVVDRLGIMRLCLTGRELVGPCSCCGGRDRFGVNIQSNAFLCRKCEIAGGDQIALVMSVLNVDFKAVLQWLCGDAPAQIDPEEMKRRKEKVAAAEREQQRAQARYLKRAKDAALGIWKQARPGHLGVVPTYLRARGIQRETLTAGIPDALRFIVDHPYVKKIDG